MFICWPSREYLKHPRSDNITRDLQNARHLIEIYRTASNVTELYFDTDSKVLKTKNRTIVCNIGSLLCDMKIIQSLLSAPLTADQRMRVLCNTFHLKSTTLYLISDSNKTPSDLKVAIQDACKVVPAWTIKGNKSPYIHIVTITTCPPTEKSNWCVITNPMQDVSVSLESDINILSVVFVPKTRNYEVAARFSDPKLPHPGQHTPLAYDWPDIVGSKPRSNPHKSKWYTRYDITVLNLHHERKDAYDYILFMVDAEDAVYHNEFDISLVLTELECIQRLSAMNTDRGKVVMATLSGFYGEHVFKEVQSHIIKAYNIDGYTRAQLVSTPIEITDSNIDEYPNAVDVDSSMIIRGVSFNIKGCDVLPNGNSAIVSWHLESTGINDIPVTLSAYAVEKKTAFNTTIINNEESKMTIVSTTLVFPPGTYTFVLTRERCIIPIILPCTIEQPMTPPPLFRSGSHLQLVYNMTPVE